MIPILNARKTSAMASPAFEQPQALDHAVAAYRAGRYLEAEQICRQIVSIRPEFFDALYVLAVVQATLGKHKDTGVFVDREQLDRVASVFVPIVFVQTCEDGVTLVATPEGLFDPLG